MVLFFRLHSLHGHLFLEALPDELHEVDDLAVRVGVLVQHVFDPLIGLPADKDQQVAVCNLPDHFRGRLITMKIHPLIEKK